MIYFQFIFEFSFLKKQFLNLKYLGFNLNFYVSCLHIPKLLTQTAKRPTPKLFPSTALIVQFILLIIRKSKRIKSLHFRSPTEKKLMV